MAVKSLRNSSLLSSPADGNSMLAGYSFNDFHHLETVQLGGNAASVTFTNLLQYSGEFQHLQIRGTARISLAQPYGSVSLRFNGDTGNNYATHNLGGNGSTVFSSASTSIPRIYDLIQAAGANNDANAFGGFVLDILDPYQTKNKTVRCLSGRATSSSPQVELKSGLWMNTTGVTSVTLVGENGNLVTSSRFSLYGIR